jgi:Fe-S-cluster containining protein
MESLKKAEDILARQDGRIGKILRGELPALVQSQAPLDRKVIRLRQIADKVAAVIAPATPCRKGCGACCHDPAIISEVDAMLVAEATGTPLASPRRLFDVAAGEKARQDYFANYVGVACAFLREGSCSIYAHRPVVCRVHHSIEDTPAPCDDGGRPAAVDLTEIYLGELRMMGRMMLYADIREFFPPPAPGTPAAVVKS